MPYHLVRAVLVYNTRAPLASRAQGGRESKRLGASQLSSPRELCSHPELLLMPETTRDYPRLPEITRDYPRLHPRLPETDK